MYNSYQNEINDEDERRDEDNRSKSASIGDVVQNLHGGKYQFSDTQYLAGNSLIGQEFAESLYSSGGTDSESIADEDDELPKWALRLQDATEHSTKPTSDTLIFDEQHISHSITIKNDERSWEKYYAYILSATSSSCIDCPFRIISQTAGVLAPRGGTPNLCDESTPYLDNAIISTEWVGSSGDSNMAVNEWLLVVGTEAEVWRYRLMV